VQQETVRRWLRQGELRGIRLSRKAGWRIHQRDLDAFLEDRTNVPTSSSVQSMGINTSTDMGDAMTLQQALDSSPHGAAVADLGDALRSRCRVSRKGDGAFELSMAAGGPFSTLHELATFTGVADLLAARPYLANLDWQPA
jgi:excisionase family DNA binding protein